MPLNIWPLGLVFILVSISVVFPSKFYPSEGPEKCLIPDHRMLELREGPQSNETTEISNEETEAQESDLRAM